MVYSCIFLRTVLYRLHSNRTPPESLNLSPCILFPVKDIKNSDSTSPSSDPPIPPRPSPIPPPPAPIPPPPVPFLRFHLQLPRTQNPGPIAPAPRVPAPRVPAHRAPASSSWIPVLIWELMVLTVSLFPYMQKF
ncbi:Protein CBG21308 [Caenorhabditis briggsae]|uniref:Protein CBG21308 n=1 Tax=Caenorhabditis briggsae TaxID=6238 RepID=A8XZT2_CAEBR|nr:Protein CBG21308 [Caenorhabditis briggsae]CAP38149.2 Protein CBG21308 [Caenorhabditis briggsae]